VVCSLKSFMVDRPLDAADDPKKSRNH